MSVIDPQPCAGGVAGWVTLEAHHFDAVTGAPWTPAVVPAGTLTALSYAVVAGTVTVVDEDGTSVAAIPTGYSASWSADPGGTLVPPDSVTADTSTSRAIVTMTVAT